MTTILFRIDPKIDAREIRASLRYRATESALEININTYDCTFLVKNAVFHDISGRLARRIFQKIDRFRMIRVARQRTWRICIKWQQRRKIYQTLSLPHQTIIKFSRKTFQVRLKEHDFLVVEFSFSDKQASQRNKLQLATISAAEKKIRRKHGRRIRTFFPSSLIAFFFRSVRKTQPEQIQTGYGDDNGAAIKYNRHVME